MSLDEFKFIFWWEWAHRLSGRLIGVVFAVQHAFHGDLVGGLYTAADAADYELALSAVTPGRDFDPLDGHLALRLSYAGTMQEMVEATERLAKWLE